jgi:hypothetical protein
MKLIHLVALPVLLASSTALAAPGADLVVSITSPSGVPVYDSGHHAVTVRNLGNRNASAVNLTIQLPVTHTSPTVHIMGVVSGLDNRCAVSGTRLVCNLNTVTRPGTTVIGFDLALPYSTAPLTATATATTTTNELNPANNSASRTLAPVTVPTTVAGRYTATNQHCTGTGLTSFFECMLYPSSQAGFASVLEANGTVSVPIEPTVTGTWTFTAPDRLVISYEDGGNPIGTVDTRSVGDGCFEGPMAAGPWTVMYEVCLTAAP